MRKDTPIQRKLMRVIMLTSGAVLLLTCMAFFAYEFFTFRQTTLQQISTLGEIIAQNSTAALAFDSREEAEEILTALKAEKHIVAACLYNADGTPFSHYPSDLDKSILPARPAEQGYQFTRSHLDGFQPVMQNNRRLGTLYLKSDLGAIYGRFQLYGIIVVLVVVVSFMVAYLMSRSLQHRISMPILALAETARAVSHRKDYSVRANRFEDDEVGTLTDAFNHMLTQIEQQNLALSQGEARVRAVLNSAISAVVVMDAKGRVTDWNVQAEKIFGWRKHEAMGQDMAGMIIPEQYREFHRQGMQQFLETGNGRIFGQVLELSALHRNGHEFPIELCVNVVRDKESFSFCGFVTDISERKKAEDEIRSFNQKLEQKVTERTNELEAANKELESFSYSVSHDLRAPLRSIHGYVNIFGEDYRDKFDDEARRLFSIISNNTERMGRLIDDLLEFSKLGRKELTKSEINVEKMVQSIIEEVRGNAGATKAGVHVSPLPSVNADYALLQQVWVNLVSNAFKYSAKRPDPKIEIGSMSNAKEVTYYVKDNGAGFNMDYVKKLFGVFQRLHKTNEFEGTGVGLAIVQRIVTKHGGRVWAEGKVDEGATFYFSLPH